MAYLMTENAVVISGPAFWDESQGPRPEADKESFARALQTVREGIATMNANPGDIGELVEPGDCAPATLGQLIMSHLPVNADERLSPEMKTYWMEVAAFLGPDWIASMRKVAAFMDKVDQF